MTTRKVTTKKELKEAIKENVDTIIISKELAKEIGGVLKLMKMSAAKISAMIAFLGAGGAAIVASVAAAPATMGFSGIVTSSALVAFATTSSISIPVVVSVILLCVVIGIPIVISLLRAYEIVDDEVNVEFGNIKIRRRVIYRTPA